MLTTKSSSFKKYGYVLEGDYSDVVTFLKKKAPMPEERTLYVRDDERMHELANFNILKERVFGLFPMQSGYCNGYNSKLNCLEYHASCEVNVAMCDIILLLATPKPTAIKATIKSNFLILILLKLTIATIRQITIAAKFRTGLATSYPTSLIDGGIAKTVPAKPVTA